MVFNRALLTYLGVLAALVVGLSLKTPIQEGKSVAVLVFLVVFQLGAIAVLLVLGVAIMTSLALFFGKGRGVVGEHELEISDAGLSERTEFNDSLHKWKGVTAVRESARFYFIRVNESGGAFHVIPKKHRISEGDVLEFVTEVKRRIESP